MSSEQMLAEKRDELLSNIKIELARAVINVLKSEKGIKSIKECVEIVRLLDECRAIAVRCGTRFSFAGLRKRTIINNHKVDCILSLDSRGTSIKVSSSDGGKAKLVVVIERYLLCVIACIGDYNLVVKIPIVTYTCGARSMRVREIRIVESEGDIIECILGFRSKVFTEMVIRDPSCSFVARDLALLEELLTAIQWFARELKPKLNEIVNELEKVVIETVNYRRAVIGEIARMLKSTLAEK